MPKKIAIIGAGIAGLALASKLHKFAHVEVFEKSRGIGGRLSTRLVEDFVFNHGSASFTAQDPAFIELLNHNQDKVKCWQPKTMHLRQGNYQVPKPHYVGVPKMSNLCRVFLERYRVHKLCNIQHIRKQKDAKWTLTTGQKEYIDFDWVICAMPLIQAHKLLSTVEGAQRLIEPLSTVTMAPTMTMMLGLNKPLDISFDIGLVEDDCLESFRTNINSSDNLEQTNTLVIHSSTKWAKNHIDDDKDANKQRMMQRIKQYIKLNEQAIVYQGLHQWRYAYVEKAISTRYIVDDKLSLGVCGDGFIKTGVEAAYHSAQYLGEYLHYQLN